MFIGSEILAPDLVWQDLRDLLDPNYFQTLKAGGRERETSACIRISCNLEKYHEWVLKKLLVRIGFCTTKSDGYSTVFMLCMLSITFPNV